MLVTKSITLNTEPSIGFSPMTDLIFCFTNKSAHCYSLFERHIDSTTHEIDKRFHKHMTMPITLTYSIAALLPKITPGKKFQKYLGTALLG